MKVIIAGSRTIKSIAKLCETMDRIDYINPQFLDNWCNEIVSGTAIGVDKLGEQWANAKNIPITRMPADWSKGKAAGHIRNAEMAKYADFAIILWDGVSPGTKGMIKEMKRAKKPYFLDLHEADI
jgi:hypothetical protein